MLRKLVRLAIVLLIAHGLYRFVPVYVHYQQFKDAVSEAALFAKDRPDAELLNRVMVLAERYQIPIDRDAIQITRDGQSTRVQTSYQENIEWLPRYRRAMSFTVSVEGWHVPPAAGDPAPAR